MKSKLFLIFLFCLYFKGVAQNYPFNLPQNIQATINVTTTTQETFNNLLLGTNIHGFSTSDEKAFVNKFNPITVRFPHGLWSNWYDWRRDVTRVFGEEKFFYKQGTNGTPKEEPIGLLANIKVFDKGNIKVGIEGLAGLNSTKKTTSGKGYDMMWTFNMSADGPDLSSDCSESIARYNDIKQKGFEVKAIEMGNECFYPGQRSSYIPNAEDYVARAKKMSAALKAQDPTIKVSIPLLRKDSWANPNWNIDLTKDQSYFDAVTIHTYVGSDPDNAADSNESYATALTARKYLLASITDYPAKVAPTKPIWLTEWGVKSGGANAVSALGQVDCYLMMSENQKTFERANWFSTNGQLNSMVVWETYTSNSGVVRPRIKYPLEKTLFGSAYEITRSVLENSTLLKSDVQVVNLTAGVKAINARVVTKEGKTTILAVNLSNQEVPFAININGSNYNGNFVHKTLAFTAVSEERTMGIDVNPLGLKQQGGGSVSLPPLSINTIDLSDLSVPMSVNAFKAVAGLKVIPNPSDGEFNIELGENKAANYNVYSLNGKKIASGYFFEATKIYIGNFQSGIYLLEVITDSSKSVEKIIIK